MVKKIGIFDSGIGGLTVYQAIRELLPNQEIAYFGDTAKVPYGEKSCQTVKQYAIDNTEFLLSQGIDLLVVACNTATAYALETIQEMFDIPIIGVVEPGARRAVEVSRHGCIAVIGTKGTIASKIYEKEIHRLNPDIQVISQACPLFVPLVEEGWIDHPATLLVIEEYMQPLLDVGVDTLLLGCTHYPILSEAIQKYCGESVTIVDSAHSCANNVKALVGDVAHEERLDVTKYFVSDDLEKFRHLGKKLLNLSITDLEVIPIMNKNSGF
jgi:glutamate racemase